MKKTFIRHSLIVALGLGLSQWAGALGLGPIQLAPGTYLGHPIRATIRVDGLNAANASKTVVKLADQEAYATRGVAFSPSHQQLRFNLRKAGKGYVIDVRSVGGISDPLVNFIVTARNGDNVITREYSVFLDPEVKPMAGGNSRTPAQNFNRAAPPAQQPQQQPRAQGQQPPALPPAGGQGIKRMYRQEPESMRGDGKGNLRDRKQRTQAQQQQQPPAQQPGQPVQPGQPPAQQPQPNASGAVNPANLQGNVYQVGPGDTLYSIANAFKPAGASTQQMIAAIKRNNPDAFHRGKLRANAQLTIPGEVGAYPKSEASGEQRTQKLRKKKAASKRQRSAASADDYGYTVEDNGVTGASPVPPAPTAPSLPPAEEPNLKQGIGLGAALPEQPVATAVAGVSASGSNTSGSNVPGEQLAPPPVPTPVLSQEPALMDNGQQGGSMPGSLPEQPTTATVPGVEPATVGTISSTTVEAIGQPPVAEMPVAPGVPATPGDGVTGQPSPPAEVSGGPTGEVPPAAPPVVEQVNPADPSPTVQLSPPEEGRDNISVIEERNPEEAPKPAEAGGEGQPGEVATDPNKPAGVEASIPSITPAMEPDVNATPAATDATAQTIDPNVEPNRPEDVNAQATTEATPGEQSEQPPSEQPSTKQSQEEQTPVEQPQADQQQGAIDANAGGEQESGLFGEGSPLWVLIAMALAALIVIGAMIYWIIARRKAKEYQEEPVEEMSAKEMEQIMSQIDAAEEKEDPVSPVRTVDNGDNLGKGQGQGAEADFFAENAPKSKSEAPVQSASSEVNLDDFFSDGKAGAKAEPDPFQAMPHTEPSPDRAPETLADKEREVNNDSLDFFKSTAEPEVKAAGRDFPEPDVAKEEPKTNDLNAIDFSVLEEPATAPPEAAKREEGSSLDFNLDNANQAAAGGAVDYEAFDINLDLAGALIEGGSGEQMRSALEEVLAKGLPDQKVIAQDLLNKLDGRA